MKKVILFIITILVVFITSCDDYLEEVNYSGVNIATSFETEEAFETLVNSTYVSLRCWYGKENGWDFTEVGTDLYTWGLDNRTMAFCTYQGWITGEVPARLDAIWRELYKGVNMCNLVLDNIDDVPYANAKVREQRKAEVLFLRAHYFWLLVETWGGVHLMTAPQLTETHEAYRSSVDDFYTQIIKDLKAAEKIFTDNDLTARIEGADYGRAHLNAVEAMLARVYLYRKDYANAQLYADRLIANTSTYSLINNWNTLWDINNSLNSENIWAVNYSDDPVFTNANLRDRNGNLWNQNGLIQRLGGSQGHVMWAIRYENTSWGLTRAMPYERGFVRWMPTRAFLELYDDQLDQRFWGSFYNLWRCNAPTASPRWPAVIYINGVADSVAPEKVGQPFLQEGDTALFLSLDPFPSDMKAKRTATEVWSFHKDKGYLIFDINDMYNADGTPNSRINNRQYYFPIMGKYNDTTRLMVGQEYSQRDIPVFRIAEMYLISMEAAVKQEQYATAYQRLTALANARAVGNNGAALLASYGIATGEQITDDVILDERGRELATEYQRFYDLKRFGEEIFLRRIKDNNTDAAVYIEGYHMVRPIPQEQLDAVHNKDEFYQNPGYN